VPLVPAPEASNFSIRVASRFAIANIAARLPDCCAPPKMLEIPARTFVSAALTVPLEHRNPKAFCLLMVSPSYSDQISAARMSGVDTLDRHTTNAGLASWL
jgi:hypothetical protein